MQAKSWETLACVESAHPDHHEWEPSSDDETGNTWAARHCGAKNCAWQSQNKGSECLPCTHSTVRAYRHPEESALFSHISIYYMLQIIQMFRVLIQFSCLVQVISIATSNGEAMRKLPSLAASSSISSLSYAQSTTSLHLSSGLITTCKFVHIIHCGRGKGHICLRN